MDKINKTKEGYFTLRKINPVIRFLTISDILMLGGYGLVSPIFAVFITGSIKGGTVAVAGLASAIYLITKSIGQIPIAHFIDKKKGEKDDFWFMLIATLLMAVIPVLYIFVKTPIELYIVQFFYGILSAATFPAWMAIFTRHIDREHEGVEWAVYYTLTDLSAAIFAFLGGFLAFNFGFANLFITMSIIYFFGALFLIGVYRYMRPGYILKN